MYDRLAFLAVKKSGKSHLAAGLGLTELIGGTEADRKVIMVSSDLAQARDIAFAAALRFVARHPWLQKHLRTFAETIVYAETVTDARTGGRHTEEHILRVVPARDARSLHGSNASLTLIDELHAFDTYDVLEALAPSAARRHPRFVFTTYAGLRAQQRDGNPLWDLWQTWQAGTDPRLHVTYIGGPDGWRSVPWIRAALIDQQRQQFLHVPSKFRRLWLNEWSTGDEAGFLAPEEIAAAIDRTLSEPARGVPGYAYHLGCDAGLTHDMTSVVISHCDPVDAKLVIDVVRLWRGSKAVPVDLQVVEDEIVRLHQRFALKTATFDAWQTVHLASRLRRRGLPGVRTVAVETSRLDAISTMLKGLFANRQIRIPAHVGLLDQLECIVGEELKRRDKVRFTTPKGRASFDDAVVAMMLSAQQQTASIGHVAMSEQTDCARGTPMECYLLNGFHYGNDVPCRECPGNVSTKIAYERHVARGGEAVGLREFAASGIRPNFFVAMKRFQDWGRDWLP